jgi:hypothetical protein
MQQVNNVLAALETAQEAVRLARDYDAAEAVDDAAFAIVELLRTLHNNNFDIADLAEQALEV